MGEEKLDNAVYTIRGYADLADMARAMGDSETRRCAVDKARAVLERFEEIWWYGVDTRSYADSLVDPGNEKVFQRHWIGLTSTDAVLPRLPFRAAGPLASREHGNAMLNEHEQSCYTGEFGLFHTGTGPTSAPAGNPATAATRWYRPTRPRSPGTAGWTCGSVRCYPMGRRSHQPRSTVRRSNSSS